MLRRDGVNAYTVQHGWIQREGGGAGGPAPLPGKFQVAIDFIYWYGPPSKQIASRWRFVPPSVKYVDNGKEKE